MTADHDLLNEGLSEVRDLLNLAQYEQGEAQSSLDFLDKFLIPGAELTDFAKSIYSKRQREVAAATRKVEGLQAVMQVVLRDATSPGIKALRELAEQLPKGGARQLVEGLIRDPYPAALAMLKVTAQLGARTDWQGADELEQIGETIASLPVPPLDEAVFWQGVADAFGIYYTPEGDDEVDA